VLSNESFSSGAMRLLRDRNEDPRTLLLLWLTPIQLNAPLVTIAVYSSVLSALVLFFMVLRTKRPICGPIIVLHIINSSQILTGQIGSVAYLRIEWPFDNLEVVLVWGTFLGPAGGHVVRVVSRLQQPLFPPGQGQNAPFAEPSRSFVRSQVGVIARRPNCRFLANVFYVFMI